MKGKKRWGVKSVHFDTEQNEKMSEVERQTKKKKKSIKERIFRSEEVERPNDTGNYLRLVTPCGHHF